MKNLVQDMTNVLKNGVGASALSPEFFSTYSDQMNASLLRQLLAETRSYEMGKLYASDVGRPCMREPWYKYRNMDKEQLSGSTKMKFMFGDIIETLALSVARLAGYEVKDEQKRVEMPLDGGWILSGRIDANINNHTVDVKSVTKQSLNKFHDGLNEDPFGYLLQLSTYKALLPQTDGAGFLTVVKDSGQINYFDYTDKLLDKQAVLDKANLVVRSITNAEPPERMAVQPDGASGNLKLCTNCSYCGYKSHCWSDANEGQGLRSFLYAGGKVVHLVHIEKLPKVMEITAAVEVDDE